MKLADVIEAVLADDRAAIRRAFICFVTNRDGAARPERVRSAVCIETCRALLDDDHLMPDGVCEQLGVVTRTSFARGADKFLLDTLHLFSDGLITSNRFQT